LGEFKEISDPSCCLDVLLKRQVKLKKLNYARNLVDEVSRLLSKADSEETRLLCPRQARFINLKLSDAAFPASMIICCLTASQINNCGPRKFVLDLH